MALFDMDTKQFLCECGCGQECNPYSDYKRGHNPITEETRANMVKAQAERSRGPDDKAIRAKISQKKYEYYNGPDGEKHRQEQSVRMAERMERLNWGPGGEEYRKRNSERKLAYYQGPDGESNRKKNSDGVKEVWVTNPDYAKDVFHNRKPNNVEAYLDKYLQDTYPGEWKYTGSGEMVIGGRIPDFTNINGQKKLIELFGTLYHDCDGPRSEEGTIEHYKEYGYECLVIWADDWGDIVCDLHLISRFCNKDRGN